MVTPLSILQMSHLHPLQRPLAYFHQKSILMRSVEKKSIALVSPMRSLQTNRIARITRIFNHYLLMNTVETLSSSILYRFLTMMRRVFAIHGKVSPGSDCFPF